MVRMRLQRNSDQKSISAYGRQLRVTAVIASMVAGCNILAWLSAGYLLFRFELRYLTPDSWSLSFFFSFVVAGLNHLLSLPFAELGFLLQFMLQTGLAVVFALFKRMQLAIGIGLGSLLTLVGVLLLLQAGQYAP